VTFFYSVHLCSTFCNTQKTAWIADVLSYIAEDARLLGADLSFDLHRNLLSASSGLFPILLLFV
jgi:hypothetical protein